MLRSIRNVRKTYGIANTGRLEAPLSATPLTGARDWVREVIFLPEDKLVVAASYDNAVRVYNINTAGEPRSIFTQHTNWVRDVVQLDKDLVVSVGQDGCLFSWRATSAQLVGRWERSTSLMSVMKLDHSRLIVGDCDGNVIVLTHKLGTGFQDVLHFQNSHSKCVNAIVAHRDSIVTCSDDKTSKLWSTMSFALVTTLRHRSEVRSAAVSDKFIITVCGDRNIYVYLNGHDYPLDYVLRMDNSWHNNVSILNEDVIAVDEYWGHVSFISLSTKSFLSRISMEDRVLSFVIVVDGRIVVGTRTCCIIFSSPESVRAIVQEYASLMYPSLSIAVPQVPPLRAAWIAVQNNQMSLLAACKTVITSVNCSTSLDEWCVAHDLLMEAVKSGDIPSSRHYDGADFHWHSELYQHCAKLAMGERCIEFVKAKFKEAESSGVIAVGQGESLINTIGIRRDMDKDNQFVVHAIYQLFLRQAEMDVRFREVLHYQEVQKMTALVNALVSLCIPVGGAVVTNLISGAAVIIDDLEGCGLMESLLGVAHEASNGFGTGGMVDRFLRRSNTMLSVEEWSKHPAKNKKVVEDAASKLGLTIEELREKLLIVAAMESSGAGEKPAEEVVVEEVDDGVRGMDDEGQIEEAELLVRDTRHIVPSSVEIGGLGGSGPSKMGLAASASPNGIDAELKLWGGRGVSKGTVGRLGSEELAACIAAYLVNYEVKLGALFNKYKAELVERFGETCIFGESFVEADEEDRTMLLDVVMTTLVKVTEKRSLGPVKMRVKKFIRLAGE